MESVTLAGEAEYIGGDPATGASWWSPVECRTCGARAGLTLIADGPEARAVCPQGHDTGDHRLNADVVRALVKTWAPADGAPVPADARVQIREVRVWEVLPGYEDII